MLAHPRFCQDQPYSANLGGGRDEGFNGQGSFKMPKKQNQYLLGYLLMKNRP